ncbi:MAG: DUF3179 domain-containing protein [Pseudomonadota bacterium]
MADHQAAYPRPRRVFRVLQTATLGLCALLLVPSSQAPAQEAAPSAAVETAAISGPNIVAAELPLFNFGTLFRARDQARLDQFFATLDENWSDGYFAPLIEISGFTSNRASRDRIFAFLEEKSGERFGSDFQAWFQWLWKRDEAITADYADFKSLIYRLIDPRFEAYFAGRTGTARIRLDEIRWGGVVQDGIPPLRQPEMLAADKADYLDDSNVVFGIEINGDARAYPQRILAWHEMFVDTIGGVEIAGVYCTLCGTVIPYRTNVDGTNHVMGTSGFLYRSNKLMYDLETQSLWSTMRGEPVVGPLVDQGIKMEFEPVITTTWGEWKRRHPDTTVLSLNTGHSRDYGEGVAYRAYFATDDLMFNTPFEAENLDNKQEVLGLRFPGAPQDQLAIDTAFLSDNPIYVDAVGFQTVAVITDTSGANRVYDPEDVTFVSFDGDRTLLDEAGQEWTLDEDHLTATDGRRLTRLPAHRSFWFGWHAAFPETRLVM